MQSRSLGLLLLTVLALTGATTNFTFRKKTGDSPQGDTPQSGVSPLWTVPEEVRPLEPEPTPPPAPSESPTAAHPKPEPEPVPPPPVSAPAQPAPPPEIVWMDDDLPADAEIEGPWVWETSLVGSGNKSHGHPPQQGLQSHAVTFAKPWPIRSTQMITQQVWLDPQNPPSGIALQLKRADGEEAGVYWEGEQEVFNPAEHEDLWYYGLLPELGRWVTLEILAEDLGLEDAQISGIRFVTLDGRALWDKTTIKEAPPLEGAPAAAAEF